MPTTVLPHRFMVWRLSVLHGDKLVRRDSWKEICSHLIPHGPYVLESPTARTSDGLLRSQAKRNIIQNKYNIYVKTLL